LTHRRAGVFVVPSTVGSEEPADAGGVLLSAAGVASPLAAGDEEGSDPVLVGGASPAGEELAALGAPVDVGSPAGAEAEAAPSTTGAEVAEGAAAASPLADALVVAPAAALIVAETGAAVVAAAALEAAFKVADAAAGARIVVWEETERIVLPDAGPPTAGITGIAGTLGMGMVIETAEGATPVFAALTPGAPTEAAAAASAGVSCLVVLLKTRVVSFIVVAGSRFS